MALLKKIILLFSFTLFFFYGHQYYNNSSVLGRNLKKENLSSDSNFTNLIVFAKFAGEDEFINNKYWDTTIKDIVSNMYDNSYFSIKNYYKSLSNGKMNIKNVFLFDNNNSLTLTNKRGYYASASDTNTIGYQPSEQNSRLYGLKTDWANAINNVLSQNQKLYSMDGKEISDYSILDQNNDNKIDAITILYRESPSSISVEWGAPLWNYQDSCSLVEFTYNNKTYTSDKYVQITNNYSENSLYKDKDGYLISSVGVIAHEMGHIFGLKDLYRNASESRVYYMSAMGKHLSPIPQFISTKEREALGWLNNGQVKEIHSNGTYSLKVVSDEISNDLISYKINLKNGKIAYLEYRNFKNNINRFDNQTRTLTRKDGSNANGITALKSGLVVFLVDEDTLFPNNMNTSGNHWNYEVLGGQYSTKSDAALGQDDEISLTSTMDIYVDNVQDNELTFTLTGGDFSEIIPEILGVEITSYPDIMKRNDSFTLKAKITGNNLTNNEKVFWSISGNTSKSTTISSDGTLTIGGDEQSSSLVVSATTENNISTNITINLNIIHSLIHHDKVEATCSKEGIEENWYCEECNKYYLDANHEVEVSLKDLTIAKTNNHIAHIEIDYLDATCEENGHTEKIVCQSCGLVMQESTIIPAKGHRLSDYIIDKEPTETEEGSKHIECLTCHKIIKVEKIEKLPHKTNCVLIIAISITAITIGTAIIVIIRKKR